MLSTFQLTFLLQGAVWTIVLSLIAMACGGLGGFLVAMARISPVRAIRIVALLYIQIVQGTPVLVLIFLFYFGLPSLGIQLSSLSSAGIALSIFTSGYLGEIWRGCILSVPVAQWESAQCLALSRSQRMYRVILPQAVRIAMPQTVGFLVQLIKNTSLASIVGFVELARAGQLLNSTLYKPFLIYVIIGAIYFMICYPLSRLSRRLERSVGMDRTLGQQA